MAMGMHLPFELHIAFRYLVARRKQAFLSLISIVSTFGVAVGVMALVIALALMTGLQAELRDRIVGSTAHVYVWKVGGLVDAQAEADRLRALPRVTGAAPTIQGKALATSGQAEAFITVKGIDPALEKQVTEVAGAVRSGSLEALAAPQADAPQGIVIGQDLANQLGAYVGDEIRLLTPEGTLTPMGMIPRSRWFRVVGIFTLGLYEFDMSYGFVSLAAARDLLRKEHVDYIELRVDDLYAAPQIAETIPGALGDEYVAQDWSDLNRSLFSALWLEKMAIAITIGLIVMVAALNIIASLILLVMEKSRDIAILKTMGAAFAQRDGHLHDARTRDRIGGHCHGGGGRVCRVGRTRPVQTDSSAHGRVPDRVRALYDRAHGFHDRGYGGDTRVFRRDALSLTPGVACGSRAGVEVPVTSRDWRVEL